MPSQQCFRSDERRDLRQQFATKLLRLCSQSSPLIVAKLEAPIADLLSQNPIFLHQIHDDMLLMLVHPTSDGDQ